MKIFTRTVIIIFSFVIFATQAVASGQKLPIIDGKEVVAMVNNEPITLQDFSNTLASIEHGGRDAEQKAEDVDYAGIINRLVTERLLLIEAGNIGLDELPEVIKALENYADETLMKTLVAEQMKNVTADQEEVEKRFRSAVREFKITSIVFENEKDAAAMDKALKSGGGFDDLIQKAIEGGSAKENNAGDYLKNKDLLPEISAVVSEMEIGALSTVIAFDQGFVLLRLDDIRYPENQEIRSAIEQAVVKNAREIAIIDYTDTLIDKHVEIDDALLDSIDYDNSMEDFEALLKDERIVARVKEGSPVTVGALSSNLEKAFHHGIEGSLRNKELNNKKKNALLELLQEIVFKKEALQQGLDKTDKYKTKLKKYRKALVLSVFMQKVLIPDIKLTEDEIRVYYKENAESYISPEMMRIEGLVFTDRNNAEDAIAKLKRGTDMKWLGANAMGLVDKDAAGILDYNGVIINPHNLPKEADDALSGAVANDYKLYESSEGHFYVLYVQNVYPSKPGVFEKVKKEIAKKVYNDKIVSALDDWTNQLKNHYKVEIYLKKF